MSLNNIQLNSFHLVELYRNSLVQTIQSPETKEKVSQRHVVEALKPNGVNSTISDPLSTGWKYLGENKKSILLVVRYTNTTYLPDEQLNFLISILGACKLSLADVAILNLANTPAGSYNSVWEQFKSRITLLFGITPTAFAMPVNFPEFQVQSLNNCTFLHTPVLEELEKDKVLKSKLWVCLRRVFNLS
jgi:hypothetical protein